MKKHITKIFSVIVMIFMCSQATARLGETYDEWITRYGQPIQTEADIVVFQKSGFFIMTSFLEENGVKRSVFVVFMKSDDLENAVSFGGDTISSDEIEVLLKANSQGHDWIEDENSFEKKWHTANYELFAMYDEMKDSLTLAEVEGFTKFSDLQKEMTEESMSDF